MSTTGSNERSSPSREPVTTLRKKEPGSKILGSGSGFLKVLWDSILSGCSCSHDRFIFSPKLYLKSTFSKSVHDRWCRVPSRMCVWNPHLLRKYDTEISRALQTWHMFENERFRWPPVASNEQCQSQIPYLTFILPSDTSPQGLKTITYLTIYRTP